MIFFFHKKKIVLDCFTYQVHAKEYAPVKQAAKFLPDWWKRMPKDGGISSNLYSELNMKSCYGLIDLYKRGVIIPMWSDLRIQLSPNGGVIYQYSDGVSEAEFHHPKQREGFAPPDKFSHIKLCSPWVFSCKENISWVHVPPIYNQEHNLGEYITCVGAVNFKYGGSTNINLLLPLPAQNKLIQIDHGQPIAHIVPLSDKQIEVRNHLISKNEYDNLVAKSTSITFLRKYEKIVRIQKHKCPMGYGSDK